MRKSILFILLSFPVLSAQDFDKNIIGYYTSWSIYARNYLVTDVPAHQINVINYAFANISNGQIVLGDYYADVDRYYPGDSWDQGSLRGNFHQLQILKEQYPHLKTLISVGGWTWSHYFSDVALTEESRTLFAQSCVSFIQEYEFDGVDIDWEYPVSGGLESNIYRPEDRQNFTLLLAELRDQLDAAGDYLLTIAAPAGPENIANIEVGDIHEYLDWIIIMTYDFHGPWSGVSDPVTNFNSPLYPSDESPLPEPYFSSFNLSSAAQTYLDLGVPRDKLNAGLAFYGRAFGGVPDINNGLYQTYWGPSPDGTWENGVFDYWHLDQSYIDQAGYIRFWHDEAAVPWLYNPSTQILISYDDELSIQAKCDYILEENLGGAMFWEFSGDKYGDLLGVVSESLMDIDCLQIGDGNGDGILDILDIVSIVGFIIGSIDNLESIACSDVNADGEINILDVVGIVNLIIGRS